MGEALRAQGGAAETVALAIEEHYWPKAQGSAAAETVEGALLASRRS